MCRSTRVASLDDGSVELFAGQEWILQLGSDQESRAASRQPENATAFAQRDSVANMMAVAAWRQGTVDPTEHMQATRKYWAALEPFTRGFYVNDLAREASAKDINANYRGNYPRLAALKRRYDPANLFRLNHNIAPAQTSAL